MKSFYKLLSLFSICLLLGACSELDLNAPKEIGAKPDPVTDYTIQSLNGGAKISFKMPASDDLLYVQAEYQLISGIKREVKSSLYKNSLIVDGFDQAGEYEVTLYAVAKGEVKSDPTVVKVEVLEPPYKLVREDIVLRSTFGGVNVAFKNSSKADLGIKLVTRDSLGLWQEVHTYFTKAEEGDFSVRGFDTIPKDFGVCVKDRWGNISDTLKKTCKPLFETVIKKNTWKKYDLPGDHSAAHHAITSWKLECIWDGIFTYDEAYIFHTDQYIDVWPCPFTIDLGHELIFSRLKLHPRWLSPYGNNNVKKFEVYGSNEPAQDGSWDSWTLMGQFEVKKPSGPGNQVTGEDVAVARRGHDFEFSPTLPSFRYMRFKILEVWKPGVQSVCIAEIDLWGQIVK